MLKVIRRNGVCEGENSIVLGDKTKYIRKLIDLYAVSADLDRDDWLAEREVRFLIATVLHVNEGINNPISKAAVQIYKKYYQFQANGKVINKILRLIENKGWLSYDVESKQVRIPSLFYNLKDCFDFKVKVSYDESKIDRSDNDGDSG